jgi:hypothetical protein
MYLAVVRAIIRISLTVALTCWCGTMATAADDLYRAQAIVTGQGEANRIVGFASCLEDVLVKVSGELRLAGDPRLNAYKADAAKLVRDFSYRDEKGGKPKNDEQGTRDRSFQDDIIRELARNGCGGQYSQEARRRDSAKNPFSMLWGEESSEPPRGGNQFGNLPFATYRTVCVRLCDGYYFPVSFSTLPNHFQRDSELCQSQCAAPADLYYHQNPGGAVEQMVSANTQQPYTSLKTAWRYRKEFVQGCSCKEAEYNPQQTGDRKAEAPATPVGKGSTARLDPR